MQYTQNYHLPQWVKEDRIMMEDFNAMNSSIESGLTATASQASAAVSTANAANETAQSASAAALACSYVVGSYTGTGAEVNINLGFRPSFLIISGMLDTPYETDTTPWDRYFGLSGGHTMPDRLAITDTGFTAYARGPYRNQFPDFTAEGRTYDYIAFR